MKQVFFFVLILSSIYGCKEEVSKNVVLPKYVLDTTFQMPKKLTFFDVIPDSLTDSLKIDCINEQIRAIEKDTTLTLVSYKDSVNTPYHGLFRNDSLVKIIKGYLPLLSMKDFTIEIASFFLWDNYEMFYFVKDTLVYAGYRCSNNMQTGRCNPVSISVETIYYSNEILAQEIEDNVGSYFGCGCSSIYFRLKSGEANFTNFVDRKELSQIKDALYVEYDY